MSKSTFIRQHPDLSVEELIAKAKEAGITITSNLVYKVRGRAKAKAANATTATAKRGRAVRGATAREVATVAAKTRPTRSKEAEAAFRKLVLDLGLQRSKALLAEVEDKLNALVAGR